jgi:hypothetical protein
MADFVTTWERRTQNGRAHFVRALEETGKLVQTVSRFQMNRLIYAHPPDRTKAGKPKWTQTRRLYDAEKAEVEPGRDEVVLVNTMVYAAARHELGRDGRQTSRPAHWRDEARETMRREFNEQLHAANIRMLEGR